MKFDRPLIRGRLLRRYKRFLADVEVEGREVTAHCANPGTMLSVNAPGSRIWLQPSTNPKRKLKWSWKLIELDHGHFAGIDTGVPNRITGDALAGGRIAPLSGYDTVRAEVKYRDASRVDFLLSGRGRPDCYLEVKNVHLKRSGSLAEFPDCVTARGAKHMGDLAAMVEAGHRACLLYVIQRTDCDRFGLAEDLDPAYAAAVRKAAAAGVELFAMGTEISPRGITLSEQRPLQLPT